MGIPNYSVGAAHTPRGWGALLLKIKKEEKVTIEKKQAEEKIVKELEKIGSKAEEMLKKTG